MQATQQHELQTKANNTHLLQMQIFRLSARRTRFLLVHGAQSSPANCETKQSVNHPNIHHSPSQHNTCTFSGASANAGPHYQKLYARVTHIWGNRKGQPDPSAMKGPRLERTASLITVPPASGKYENSWRGHRSNPNLLTSISLW